MNTNSRTYLITKDLVETLERKISIPLSSSLRRTIRGLENSFLNSFWNLLPEEVEKESVESSLATSIFYKILSKRALPLISLDRIYLPEAEAFLEVTRKTDQYTGEITITERPGSKTIQEQIESIDIEKEVAIGDVGAFEGTTVAEVIDLLNQRGIVVKEVYLSFTSLKALQKLNGIRKVSAINIFDFYEWVELRDLFGIDGRIVKYEDNQRVFIPYWENLTGWASIQEDAVPTVKMLCQEHNEALINLLKRARKPVEKIGRTVQFKGSKK